MEAKVWFYFICHSLLPTRHTSTLNMERVFLLACIVKLVCEQSRAWANKKIGEMFFPTLICMLYRASGVVVTIEDIDYYAQGTISAYDLS